MKRHKNDRKKIGIVLLLISVGIGISGYERKTVFQGKYQAERKSFENQKERSFSEESIIYGVCPIERKQKREVLCDSYTIKSKSEREGELRISFPVIELKNQDQEIQQRLNEYFYQQMTGMRNDFRESIGYTIVYADEEYLSFLYHSSNHTRVVTVSLETGFYIFVRELWIGETRLRSHFLEAEFWYCEPDQLERIVEKLKNHTKSEVLSDYKWYFTENGMGAVLPEELCVEIIYNWREHVRNKEAMVDYEMEEIQQVKRETYEITEEIEDIAAKDEHYNKVSKVHYPKIEMEDEEKAKQINQILYEMALYYKGENEYGIMNLLYSVKYDITYANERYISILYWIGKRSLYHIGVTIDLETGKQVGIKELGITEEDIEHAFLEANVLYPFGGIDVELIFSEKTRREVIERWEERGENKERMCDYFLREGRIELILDSIRDGDTWIECPYDWEKTK